jgi:galactonate dehydratase
MTKITDIKTFFVHGQLATRVHKGRRRNWIFVKVYTDDGLEGVGECVNQGSRVDLATGEVVKGYRRWLLGKDPTKITYNRQALYSSSGFPLGAIDMTALSGIEVALWDILGKKYGVPVYKLLGGPCRDKIRVYTSLFYHGRTRTPEELAETASKVVKDGYTAVKMDPNPPDFGKKDPDRVTKEVFDRVKAVRDAVGEDVLIGVDYCATEFSPANVIKIAKAIEPLNPFFLEEPVLPDNIRATAEVKDNTSIPIATGERLLTIYGFRELLETKAVDIVQPDPLLCGGIRETLKIAAMAEAHYITVAPHMPYGPVGLAACVNIDSSITNFLIQEYKPDDEPPRSEVIVEPIKFEKGYLQLPTTPGIGVELNEDSFEKYPYEPFDREVIIREDGSIGFNN